MEPGLKLRNMTAIYLLKEDRILMLYRQGSEVVNDKWIGSAGGHFEERELNNPVAGVLRELEEELSVTENMIENLALRYIMCRRVRNEIRQNYYFFADLKDETDEGLNSNEGMLKWFGFDEVSALEMPISAKYMMEHFLTMGRYNDKIYVGTAGSERGFFSELTEC